MGFKSVLKHVGKLGRDKALPIAAAFGVPGASSVVTAVDIIFEDKDRPNDDASKLLAATVDALDERISNLEQVQIANLEQVLDASRREPRH